MIKYTVCNRRENITYYYHQQERLEHALGTEYGENSIQMMLSLKNRLNKFAL